MRRKDSNGRKDHHVNVEEQVRRPQTTIPRPPVYWGRYRIPFVFCTRPDASHRNITQLEPALEAMLLLAPMERVNAVRPLWRAMPGAKRAELLAVNVDTLRETAKQVADTAMKHAGKATRLYASLDLQSVRVVRSLMRVLLQLLLKWLCMAFAQPQPRATGGMPTPIWLSSCTSRSCWRMRLGGCAGGVLGSCGTATWTGRTFPMQRHTGSMSW